MPAKKKSAKPARHKKLDEIFFKIEKDEKEIREIEEITFHQLKKQNKKR